MKSDSQPAEPPPSIAEGYENYASSEEVERAIKALSDADYIKLMMIAQSFCKRRKLSPSVLEPQELLSEAIVKTCLMQKRWKKTISIVRHLDRAMENISGHLAGERSKILPFPDGLTPGEAEPETADNPPCADDAASAAESAGLLLKAVFTDDERAKRVFLMRVDEIPVPTILARLNLTEAEYETIARRIRRKISKFLANPISWKTNLL